VAADDPSLIRRICDGDRAAFEVLYGRYYRRLFAFVHRLSRRSELVEEVVDDVLLTVWQDAPRFDGRSQVSSWILGIAYYKSLKAVGREVRERGRRAAIEAAQNEWDRAPGPERAAAAGERARVVARALAELSAEQRAVVELTYFEGLSYPEIAEVVGCPVNTVKTRMFHARRHLRRVLPTLGLADVAEE